jgi:hypothetical protein
VRVTVTVRVVQDDVVNQRAFSPAGDPTTFVVVFVTVTVFVMVIVFVVVTVRVWVLVSVVVQDVVEVVAIPVMPKRIVAVERSYESPRPDLNVMVIVDEKLEPGPRMAGTRPLLAENPFPDGVTDTPRVERVAGRFPVFSTV